MINSNTITPNMTTKPLFNDIETLEKLRLKAPMENIKDFLEWYSMLESEIIKGQEDVYKSLSHFKFII